MPTVPVCEAAIAAVAADATGMQKALIACNKMDKNEQAGSPFLIRTEAVYTDRSPDDHLLGVARLVDGEHIVFYTARRHDDYYEALSEHFAQHPPTDWLREFFSTPDDLIPDPPPLTGPNRNLTQDAAGNLISRRTWEQLRRDERAKKASVDWRNETSRMGYLRMQAIISWTPRE